MRAVARLASLCRGLFQRARMDAELDEELRACHEELSARKIAAGLDAEAARSAARLELGDLRQLKLVVREAWLVSAWDAAFQDVRQAWRGLAATRALSTLAVATFALGIGSAAAILGVLDATLLKPPPYRDPDRLLLVWADMTAAGYPHAPLSGPELEDLRRRTRRFDGFGAVWANSVTLVRDGEARFLRVGLVTPELLPLLGVEPLAGRLFDNRDAVAGPPTTIVLGHQLWQRDFGGDPGVVGQSVDVNGRLVTVIGVLPAGFRLLFPQGAGIPDSIDAYLLLQPDLAEAPRGQRFLRVVGRTRPGTSLSEARQDVDQVAGQLAREFPSPDGLSFVTLPLAAEISRPVRGPVLMVGAGVVLLLLIAAVNVLGVLVARAAARRREIAMRVALGAGRLRILRLALAEGLTLAGLGTALGIALGRVELGTLRALQPEALRRLGQVSLNLPVLAGTSALALLWGLLFALAPLGELAHRDVSGALRSARGETRRLRPRLRAALVVAQVSLTVVLLVAACLLERSFAGIRAIDPGFRAGGVLAFRVPSSTPAYASPAARQGLARRLREALRALPTVSAVGAVSHLPFDTIPNWGGPYSLVETSDTALPNADYRSVDPGFFEAAGVELVSGRGFDEADGPASQPVAIVDELLAARLWPGASALGRPLHVDPQSNGQPDTWVTVVGVARHVRQRSLVERLNEQVYFPLSQAFRNPVAYLVRTSGDPGDLAPAVRAAVRGVDPRLPVYEVQPLSVNLERAREVQRFTATLVAAFAAAALVLAAIGIYSLIAYMVVARRREFGVRLALGATHARIVRLVLGEGARLVAIGFTLGSAGAVVAGRLMRGLLFGAGPDDPFVYWAVLAVLALAALLACLWPLRLLTSAELRDVLRAE
jgi:putative ABC transport system permease protein